MSSTSQKHKEFVAEPMGEKPVMALAGIGEALGGRLESKGFDKRAGSRGFMTKAELQREAQPLCDKSFTVKKRVGCKKTRDYVPQKRSGGYAVLVTLYRDHQKKRVGCKKTRDYVPQKRSGGYAVLVTLYRDHQSDPGSKYTAWSSVSTLIQKDLLLKTNSPARYSLTEKGLELAEKLEERGAEPGQPGGAPASLPGVPESKGGEILDLTEGEEEEEGEEGEEEEPPEDKGSSGRKQELVTELRKNGVDFDVRKLNVGDFLWTARERVRYIPGQLRAPQARELVLDYIVERKRMDDLCGSIIDGRFREQKAQTVRELLARQLMQISGISGDKAAAILGKYSTLNRMLFRVRFPGFSSGIPVRNEPDRQTDAGRRASAMTSREVHFLSTQEPPSCPAVYADFHTVLQPGEAMKSLCNLQIIYI
ncbi:UNVERIFIED_CONTAM: hypothetical protein FKN15_019115 [Acipenser sinensis]